MTYAAYPRGYEPVAAFHEPGRSSTFPGVISETRRDATISIARLTESDASRRSAGHPEYRNLRPVVDVSRLVMAIWSLSAIRDIPDKLPTEHQANNRCRIATLVQEERPLTCPLVHQRPSRC
jgi:hypothetical protein